MRRTGTWMALLLAAPAVVLATSALAQNPQPAPSPSASASASAQPAQDSSAAQPPAPLPPSSAVPTAAGSSSPGAPAIAPPASPQTAAPSPAPAAAMGGLPAAIDGSADAGMVEIHIDSPTPVELIRRHENNTDWWTVCTSPCDVRVPRGDSFMIVGKDINRSKPFQIDASHEGRVNVKVTPGSKSKRTTGMWVLGGSGAVALGGIVVLAAGISPSHTFTNDGTTHNENQTAIAVGSLLVVAGITGGITGGAWMLDNSRTAVDVGTASASRTGEPQPPAPQAGLSSMQRAPAATWMFPLFGGTF